ncbi:LamB/YcsF family protein [Fangia hongkongensis]|uniref:LamB/YcsF family protein n=1 Tax=Fangia hongkongensis TaxID=270495 RepID=UPI00036F3039|nr:5-oxoprolinase subunit PxpA [Fangia hongkongensis]MBK2124972.1 LamB/YcsF family protein [Fangia hongkongensis]
MKIDLNCDMGEHFGVYRIDVNEDEIMSKISSINIACGFHAGDPHIMHQTLDKAIKYNLNIGAHPGLPDLLGFGRRKMAITEKEAYDFTLYQIGALFGFVMAKKTKLSHVKPHGALYNMAAVDSKIATGIANAVYDFDPNLTLFALSGSELAKAGNALGLKVANEVFADRTYQEDGTLTPRSQKNCFVESDEKAVSQVLSMIQQSKVMTVTGKEIEIKADTVCIHGDGAHALEFVQALNQSLLQSSIEIAAIS